MIKNLFIKIAWNLKKSILDVSRWPDWAANRNHRLCIVSSVMSLLWVAVRLSVSFVHCFAVELLLEQQVFQDNFPPLDQASRYLWRHLQTHILNLQSNFSLTRPTRVLITGKSSADLLNYDQPSIKTGETKIIVVRNHSSFKSCCWHRVSGTDKP